jgi:DNA-binding transcriptional LysR family regulator
MELRQIRYFIAVAEHLSYSKAARQLHVSVSPLSRQIRQLEEEFGVQLFARDRRRVALTDAGRLFLEDAKALVSQTTSVLDHLRLAQKGEVGAVRLGIGLHLGDKVSKVVVEHTRLFPAVDLQGQSIFSTLQNAALVERKIDIGFLRPPVDRARLHSEFLFEEKLIALMSRTNPLSKRKSLRVRDLAEQTLFLPDVTVGSGLRNLTLDLLAKAGVSPRISPVSADPLSHGEVHKILLAANKGIFVIAEEPSERAEYGNEAATVPLDEPGARIEVHMAWRRNENSPAVLGVLETARKVFAPSNGSRAARYASVRQAASA